MDKLWTFSKFTNVDPTNNLAERDLRRLVLWRKKSYGTRSARGERFVERMTTVAETVRKAGNNILNFITKAVLAFYKREATPSISPCFSF
jgi:transposase